MSICWSCGVELGYHQSNKRHPGVADPSSNKYAWGSIIFRRDCVGGYINVFVSISPLQAPISETSPMLF